MGCAAIRATRNRVWPCLRRRPARACSTVEEALSSRPRRTWYDERLDFARLQDQAGYAWMRELKAEIAAKRGSRQTSSLAGHERERSRSSPTRGRRCAQQLEGGVCNRLGALARLGELRAEVVGSEVEEQIIGTVLFDRHQEDVKAEVKAPAVVVAKPPTHDTVALAVTP